jgi:hypothetical protein
VHRSLSLRTGSARLRLPPDVRAWAADLSESWTGVLAQRGYHIEGSLEDLLPDRDDLPFVDPDHPEEADVADAGLHAVVTLLEELAHVEVSLRADLEATYVELERSRSLWFRVKRRLVREADHRPALARALVAYRRVRGRSSRSA